MARGRSLMLMALVAVTGGCTSVPPSPYVSPVRDMAVGDMGVSDMAVRDMAGPDASTTLVSTFGPDAVYLHGTFYPGFGGRDAIDDFNGATRPRAGFVTSVLPPGIIRPTDGRLIYLMINDIPGHLRVFSADSWRQLTSTTFDYPEDPETNDARVATPECSYVRDFRIEPDTGDIQYRCGSCTPGVLCNGVVYRVNGGTYPLGPTNADSSGFWWPGNDGVALRGASFSLELAFEDAAAIVIETDLSDFDTLTREIRTVRATQDGFRVVTVEGQYFTAFLIARDGNVTLEGTYPRWGDEYNHPDNCVLDGDGALYCTAYRTDAFQDVVFRFVLGAAQPVIVHDEATGPTVQMHASTLFTGP